MKYFQNISFKGLSSLVISVFLFLTLPSLASASDKSHYKSSAYDAKAHSKKHQLEKYKSKVKSTKSKKAKKVKPIPPTRVKFKMAAQETQKNGLVISTVFKTVNLPLTDEGSVSVELDIANQDGTVILLEQCTASQNLPFKVKADTYELMCALSNRNKFRAILSLKNAAVGIYSGSARITSEIEGVEDMLMGVGTISLEKIAPAPEPVDCGVTDWSVWSACVDGVETRSRSIAIEPAHGGLACPELNDARACSLPPVDCEVSDWSAFSSCVDGSSSRTRSILVDSANGGASCPALSESVACDVPQPIDCVVSDWGAFGACINGSSRRSRSVLTEPANGGLACPTLRDTRSCP